MYRNACFKIYLNLKNLIELLDSFMSTSEYSMSMTGETIKFRCRNEQLVVAYALDKGMFEC